jgi:hypothetical protein
MTAIAIEDTKGRTLIGEDKVNSLRRLLHTISDAGSSLDQLAGVARGCGEFDLAKRVLGYQSKLIDASKDVTGQLEELQNNED